MNLSNKKKIIITGGCGFIGSSLIEFLLKKNFKILNLDKLAYSANKDINTIFKSPKYECSRVKHTLAILAVLVIVCAAL